MKVRCVRLAMRGTVEDRCSDIQVEKLDMICDTMNDESMLERLVGNVVEKDVVAEVVVAKPVVVDVTEHSDCDDMPLC
jgi:hypothetical protein